MRILFFCEGFSKSAIIAQPWRHVYEIAKRLGRLGQHVSILSDYCSNLPRDEKIGNILVQRIERKRIFLDFNQLLRNLNNDCVDLINWYSGPLSAIYFWRMQNLFKKSIVWNLYKGPIFFEDIRNLRPKESFSLFNNVMLLYSLTPSFIIKKGANIPQVKKIITWSTRMKNHLRTIGIPQNKVSVIPSGVDIRVFKPLSDEKREDLKVEWRFNQDNLIVFYYGLLSTLRGLDILISSFLDEIAWRVPDARLLILGRECQDISRLRASYLKKAKNSDKILLIEGTQPRSIVREALALSDVVALPFKLWPHQDCPSTVLEAMAMAKPLITTYTGSLPEIVKNGKTGILIPPGNTKALSQAILKLLSDNKFSRQIGRTARLYVKRFYDWNVVLKQTICVFRKVLNENTD